MENPSSGRDFFNHLSPSMVDEVEKEIASIMKKPESERNEERLNELNAELEEIKSSLEGLPGYEE